MSNGQKYFSFSLCFSTSSLLQVNAYYDYEDVIDSDEELDLASMVAAP